MVAMGPHLTLRGTFIDVADPAAGAPSPRARSEPRQPRKSLHSHADGLEDQQKAYIERLDEMYHQDCLATWTGEGRLSSALSALEDIPRRIFDDMQKAASYIIDKIQAEVSALGRQIRGGAAGAPRATPRAGAGASAIERAVKKLERIPGTVRELLEARVARAQERVRRQVRGALRELELRERPEDQTRVTQCTQKLSRDVVQIAGDAVRAAAQECQAHASEQVDWVLSALKEHDHSAALASLGAKPPRPATTAQTAPPAGSEATRLAWEASQDVPRSAMNQVVADELLRARIRRGGAGDRRPAVAPAPQTCPEEQKGAAGGGLGRPVPGPQSRGSAAPQAQGAADPGGKGHAERAAVLAPGGRGAGQQRVMNLGSRGHPDLCRPCLFYMQGMCTKGDRCTFCHIPHPKRPVRFDKLHRESLKRMTFGHLAGIMLPVIQRKAESLDLYADPDTCRLLHRLWPQLELHAHLDAAGGHAHVADTDAADRDGYFAGAGAEMIDEGVPDDNSSDVDSADMGAWLAHDAGTLNSTAASVSDYRGARKEGSFASVLQVMTLRSVLATLASKVPPEVSEVRELAEALLQRLHAQRHSHNRAAGRRRFAPGLSAPFAVARGGAGGGGGGGGRRLGEAGGWAGGGCGGGAGGCARPEEDKAGALARRGAVLARQRGRGGG